MPRPVVLSLDEAAGRLAAAEELLQRWTATVADQQREADVLAADLVEAQERAADDLLDVNEAEHASAAAARVSRLLAEKRDAQSLAVQAAQRAGERLAGVRREVLRARGAAVRSRGWALDQTATARQARTDQMLADVAAFEQVDYAPAQRGSASGVGLGMVPLSLTQRVRQRAGWLATHASGLEQLADYGSDDQVIAHVEAGLPVLDPVELQVADQAAAV